MLPSKHLVLGVGQAHLLHLNIIEHHFESGLMTHTKHVLQESVLSQVKHVQEGLLELNKLKAILQDRLAILLIDEPNGYWM